MIKIKIVIKPKDNGATEKLKKLCADNKKVFFKLLRAGSQFIVDSKEPLIVHFVSKWFGRFPCNSFEGVTLKEPMKTALFQTLEKYDLKKSDVEVTFID